MDASTKEKLNTLLRPVTAGHRLSHTVILQSDDEKLRDEAALYLCAYAVCREKDRPCLSCPSCQKALKGIHPDVTVPELSGKTALVNMDTVREIIRQANIIPNEADTRVVVFPNADKTLPVASQNALLKLIEEPPQSSLFVFCAEKSAALLETVRSRAQLITLKGEKASDAFCEDLAHEIIKGIVSLYEKDLLLPLSVLSQKEHKEKFLPVLSCVTEKLRLALSHLCGIHTDDEDALMLAQKLSKEEILSMIGVSDDAAVKARTNINMTLLCTWLCISYRRILWQK